MTNFIINFWQVKVKVQGQSHLNENPHVVYRSAVVKDNFTKFGNQTESRITFGVKYDFR